MRNQLNNGLLKRSALSVLFTKAATLQGSLGTPVESWGYQQLPIKMPLSKLQKGKLRIQLFELTKYSETMMCMISEWALALGQQTGLFALTSA